MDSDGANTLFIVTCLLLLSVIVNIYFAQGIWTANRKILVSPEFSSPAARGPQLNVGVGTLHMNLDALLEDYQGMHEERRRLEIRNQRLTDTRTKLREQLKTMAGHLTRRSYTHYLYYMGKGVLP